MSEPIKVWGKFKPDNTLAGIYIAEPAQIIKDENDIRTMWLLTQEKYDELLAEINFTKYGKECLSEL